MQIKELVRTDFIKLDRKEPISKLLGQLKLKKKRNALVFDGKKFLGIISKRGLLKSKVMTKKMKVRAIVRPIATISEEADVLEAAYLMFNVDTNILPVERKGKIIGVLSIFDLLGQLKKYDEIKKLKISEVKIEKLKPVKETERIGKIINEMNTFNTYEMPIWGKEGKLIGLISISDIYDKFVSGFPVKRETRLKVDMTRTKGFEGEKPEISALPVNSFGTLRDIYFEDINEKITEVVREMRKHDVMGIVVRKAEKPMGLVTANNLLRVMAALYKGPEYNIWISGLKKTTLEPYQKEYIQKIISNLAVILGRAIKNNFIFRIRIKEHEKEGKRHKWSVKMKVEFPGKMISGDEHDWDIETAVRKAFNNLKRRVEGYFRGNVRGWDKEYE